MIELQCKSLTNHLVPEFCDAVEWDFLFGMGPCSAGTRPYFGCVGCVCDRCYYKRSSNFVPRRLSYHADWRTADFTASDSAERQQYF